MGVLDGHEGFAQFQVGHLGEKQRLLAVRSMELSFDIGVLRVTQVKWRRRGWLMKFIAWFVFLNISVDSPKCCDLEQSKHTRPMDFDITTQS